MAEIELFSTKTDKARRMFYPKKSPDGNSARALTFLK
jgi:hypothetical protein